VRQLAADLGESEKRHNQGLIKYQFKIMQTVYKYNDRLNLICEELFLGGKTPRD